MTYQAEEDFTITDFSSIVYSSSAFMLYQCYFCGQLSKQEKDELPVLATIISIHMANKSSETFLGVTEKVKIYKPFAVTKLKMYYTFLES